jgi:hypothetical protein
MQFDNGLWVILKIHPIENIGLSKRAIHPIDALGSGLHFRQNNLKSSLKKYQLMLSLKKRVSIYFWGSIDSFQVRSNNRTKRALETLRISGCYPKSKECSKHNDDA